MKISYYRLRINTHHSREQLDLVTQILEAEPIAESWELHGQWVYERVEAPQDPFLDFVTLFLDLLEGKYDQLESIGIQHNDIAVWAEYAYSQQCNLEYSPEALKRLGENQIAFLYHLLANCDARSA